jgi:uncharacterized membrane protein
VFDLNDPQFKDITEALLRNVENTNVFDNLARDLRHKAKQAGKLNGEDFSEAAVHKMALAELDRRKRPKKAEARRTIERTGDWLKQPDPPWLFDKLLPKGELAFIYGPSGSYKSFAALLLAGAVTTGQPFGGKANLALPGASLYLAAEGQTGIKRRIAALDQVKRFDIGLSYIDRSGVQLHNKRERQNFIAQLRDLEHKPRVITIDTFARHGIGLDENSSRDTSLWVGAAEEVGAEFNSSVMTVHHSGKDVDRGMRGSSALFGAASTVIRAERNDRVVTLLCDKQRDYDEFDPIHFQLRNLTDELAFLDYDHVGYYLSEDEQIIMDIALRNVPKPFGTLDLVRPNNTKIPRSTAHRLIRGLVAKGLIYKVCHAQYAAKIP